MVHTKEKNLTAGVFWKHFSLRGNCKDHIWAVVGARMGTELFDMVQEAMPLPVENSTCVNHRSVGEVMPTQTEDFEQLMEWYAGELLRQMPCMRMIDHTGRKQLYQEPDLKGIIYHTVKFCDFYSFEYVQLKIKQMYRS